jgi:hypothetical protein
MLWTHGESLIENRERGITILFRQSINQRNMIGNRERGKINFILLDAKWI